MFQDATDELEGLPPELMTTREVLSVRALIYHQTGEWQLLREVGGYLVHHWPGESQHWIWVAYGTRRCHSIAEAERFLVDALKLHDSEPMIHFNLACYAAQTGDLVAARVRLARPSRVVITGRLRAMFPNTI